MKLNLPFLAREALTILERNLDIIPLNLKNKEGTLERIFEVTMELEEPLLKKSMTDYINKIIAPACSALAMKINNTFPINGCEFTRLELSENTMSCVACYEGISVKLESMYNLELGKEVLILSVGISKMKNIVVGGVSNTIINPVTIIITKDELILKKKNEELIIEDVSEDGDGCRIKTLNKRELKKIGKFIINSIL